jgi:protein-disulfide isomerase
MGRAQISGPERWKLAFDAAATCAMVVASGVLVWAILSSPEPTARGAAGKSARAPRPLPATPLSLQAVPMLGKPTAKVAVIEYLDFECPFCVKFAATTYAAVVRSYVEAGRVRFGVRHMPLEQKHPAALGAAEAAECSRLQGRFWPLHDALFAAGRNLDRPNLIATAQNLGLDTPRFEACMKGEATPRVREDIAEARRLGITGTPTFLFGVIGPNGSLTVLRRESGAIPTSVFTGILDELLRDAGPDTR